MKKEFIIFMLVCLILLLSVSPSVHLFKDRFLHAQSIQNNSSVSQLQRLGTTHILDPPDNISITLSNHNNSSLDDQFDEQFIILGNNLGTRQNLAISNPDYGLSAPIPVLMTGENFLINSSTDADIVYSTATVKLVPITSPFPPPNTNIEDVDPEDDTLLGTPINLGNYTGNIGSFVIPHTASPGYYLLYVYFHYPTYNLTVVYNTAVQLKGSLGTKP
jgi:hypothetical protein